MDATKYKLALRVLTAVAPVILAVIAGWFYDVRPITHDICEAILPFGSMVQPGVHEAPVTNEPPDAGR